MDRRFLLPLLALAAALACGLPSPPTADPDQNEFGGEAADTPTPFPTPMISYQDGWVSCVPPIAFIKHGERVEYAFQVNLQKAPLYWSLFVDPDSQRAETQIEQQPLRRDYWRPWSPEAGFTFISTRVHPSGEIKRYDFEFMVERIELVTSEEMTVSIRNVSRFRCIAIVTHPELTPTPTITPTPTLTPTATPTLDLPSPFITTPDGSTVYYRGPDQVNVGEDLVTSFQVLDQQGRPGRGELFASLFRDDPNDSRAAHTSGQLDANGMITLLLRVHPAWEVDQPLTLYISWLGKVVRVAQIALIP